MKYTVSNQGVRYTVLSLVGMSLTLGRNNDVVYKLFLPRESLVSDIPVGDKNIEKLFYGVQCKTISYFQIFIQ